MIVLTEEWEIGTKNRLGFSNYFHSFTSLCITPICVRLVMLRAHDYYLQLTVNFMFALNYILRCWKLFVKKGRANDN